MEKEPAGVLNVAKPTQIKATNKLIWNCNLNIEDLENHSVLKSWHIGKVRLRTVYEQNQIFLLVPPNSKLILRVWMLRHLIAFYGLGISPPHASIFILHSSSLCWPLIFQIQGGERNVIPFYHPIKIVTSQYRCCKRASECCSSWKMR